jgi:N-acetylglutamate synthase/N-acetylornithine aminotransferase
VNIEVKLKQGKAEATMYTCDLSKKYITINSMYTT